MRAFINVPFSEDLTGAALAQVRDHCVLVFPTRISAARARERFMESWALQDCEFVAMEDFKAALLLPSQPPISDDKRLLCLYQSLSQEDRDYFHINGYFDIVDWGNSFFQFFEELCDECVDAWVLQDLPGNTKMTLLNWQEDYLAKVLAIRKSYQASLAMLGQSDPIFSRNAESIRVPFCQTRLVFVNQYYYSKLESALLDALEEAGNEVLVLVQGPKGKETGLEPPRINLSSLQSSEFTTRQIEVIECENAEQMALVFLANHPRDAAESTQSVLVDSHFSQAHYRELFDPARFASSSQESVVNSGCHQMLGLFQTHLEAMRATLDEAFLPLRQILDACSREDFLRYHGLSAGEKEALLEELRYLLQKDILYVDKDLRLLDKLRREQGFGLLGQNLSRHFSLLEKLAKISRPQDLIDLIDAPDGLVTRDLCREEELLHSNILEVFYERLSNFASLETLGGVENWSGLFDCSGTALAASVLRLFLESLGSAGYSFNQARGADHPTEISNLLDLRNLRHEQVYFFHAVEGEIPSNPSPVWLLNENQRARLGLKSYPDLRERERYYFLRTVLTSRRCVLFTYRDQERDIEPGSFVTELAQAGQDKLLAGIELREQRFAPRLSKLYLARFEKIGISAAELPGLDDPGICGPAKPTEGFFVLPCHPEADFGPERKIKGGFYNLSWFQKNPFAWYVEQLRKLPELELRPQETLTRKLFGSIMHSFLAAVLLPLAREGADLARLEQAFTDTRLLRDTLAGLLNDPDRLYLYKIPQNYNHEFLVSIISDNLVDSIRQFFTQFLAPNLQGLAFRLIPEEEFMTEQESQGRKLVQLEHAGKDYSLWVRGKADLRIESPELNYIVDFKTGQSDSDQLIFYEWLYYLLDEAWDGRELKSTFWLVFKRETEGKGITDKSREDWRQGLTEALAECLEQGFALGKKAGDREKLTRITRADLFRAGQGGEA